jgi:hypothetical protein
VPVSILVPLASAVAASLMIIPHIRFSVIASEAKQSMLPQTENWIASSLRSSQ